MTRSDRRRRAAGVLMVLGGLLSSGEARAQCLAPRPTDAGGVFGFAYDDAPVETWDAPGGAVRVHWAADGPHAPDREVTPPNEAPDFVVTVGEVAAASLAAYAELGFRAPRADDAGPCGSDGGDGRVDVYLVDFVAGDGQVISTHCTAAGPAATCAGFALVDHRLPGYGDVLTAARTVVAHEMFHLVQHAFTGDLPAWLSEGTAQWAADRLHPELDDLEAFLPAFFEETDRPIDVPPGGAAGAFLYGSAIWPVFLTERFDADVVLDLLDAMGEGHAVWDAHEVALAARGSSMAEAFPTFAAWNAATGSRAGAIGYADAASYPEVPLVELDGPLPRVVEGATSGFSSRYFRVPAPGEAASASLDDPDDRHRAAWLAIDGEGAAATITGLPAAVAGDGVAIVTGSTPQKPDGPFTLRIVPASAAAATTGAGGAGEGGGAGAGPPGDGGAGGVGEDAVGGGPGGAAAPASGDGCGCTLAGAPTGALAAHAMALLVVATTWRRRRRAARDAGRRAVAALTTARGDPPGRAARPAGAGSSPRDRRVRSA